MNFMSIRSGIAVGRHAVNQPKSGQEPAPGRSRFRPPRTRAASRGLTSSTSLLAGDMVKGPGAVDRAPGLVLAQFDREP